MPSFSIDTKFGSDIKIWSKEIVATGPHNIEVTKRVLCIETITGSPAMLTREELKKTIQFLVNNLDLID